MVMFFHNIVQLSRFSEKRISHPDPEIGSFILDGGNVERRMESEGSFLRRLQ